MAISPTNLCIMVLFSLRPFENLLKEFSPSPYGTGGRHQAIYIIILASERRSALSSLDYFQIQVQVLQNSYPQLLDRAQPIFCDGASSMEVHVVNDGESNVFAEPGFYTEFRKQLCSCLFRRKYDCAL